MLLPWGDWPPGASCSTNHTAQPGPGLFSLGKWYVNGDLLIRSLKMKTPPFNFKVNPISETLYLTLKLFYKVFAILYYSYITLFILQNVILKQGILYP